jgi:hypothetical protein
MAIRLVYASRLASGVQSSDIDAIAATFADRNARRGITGILALDGDHVCQILEGPDEDVSSLFDTITKDRRHEGVVELHRTSIERPRFAAWGMARRPMIDVVMMAYAD